jgi:uncharacterized protein (TIGR03437 family)
VAPGSVAAALGVGLASGTTQAAREEDGTFPESLLGTSITVNGRPASIFYVSSTQVNFQMPAETEGGVAQVIITNQTGLQMRATIAVANAAPGIFTEDGTGRGRAVVFDLDKLLGKQIVQDDGQRRFYVYATGVRAATSLVVTVNGQPVTIERVRACRGLPGLDQITIVFPDNLGHTGYNSLVISADGVVSNTTVLFL